MEFSNGVGGENESSGEDDNGKGKKKMFESTEGMRRRGRPLGSKNRPKPGEDLEVGEGSRPIPLILSTGSNIVRCLHHFIDNHVTGIFISTARGLVSQVKIRAPGHQEPISLEGIFELTGLCGALIPASWNLPLKATLEAPQGQVIKGEIFEDHLLAAGPLTILVTRLASPFRLGNPLMTQYGNGLGNGIMPPSSAKNNGFPSTPLNLLPPPGPAAPSQPAPNVLRPCNGIGSSNMHMHNNGFSTAAPTPGPLSQANDVQNEYPSSPHHHTARMNNDYPPAIPGPSVADFLNNGYFSGPFSTPAPPSSSQANHHVKNEYPSSSTAALGMNINDYLTMASIPDFSISPFDSPFDISNFASLPDPANGGHYSVPWED
ncbi:hypothetical protein SUGI_0200020 [Cryptomeria japonica]|uniref:AT-hook motif nuclear-localized protein 23 n=1 Tax=Cryptomeria japonica TaxID=3369 RepID=UPI002408BAAC|nr:AT-hook motif nuclear-localized protein 23 [Cryptomeria japonica]GLJ12898.1 hypothetical protein SUGI_0200020 [Cryptomeria japonica]